MRVKTCWRSWAVHAHVAGLPSTGQPGDDGRRPLVALPSVEQGRTASREADRITGRVADTAPPPFPAIPSRGGQHVCFVLSPFPLVEEVPRTEDVPPPAAELQVVSRGARGPG